MENSPKTSLSKRLQERWQLRNGWQLFRVLLAFACTGTTVLLIKPFLLEFTGLTTRQAWFDTILYLLLVLPLYQLLLLAYGFIFGEFYFFWNFEKKMLRRMGILPKIKNNEK